MGRGKKIWVADGSLTHEFLERSKAYTFLVFLKVYKGFVSCYEITSESAQFYVKFAHSFDSKLWSQRREKYKYQPKKIWLKDCVKELLDAKGLHRDLK